MSICLHAQDIPTHIVIYVNNISIYLACECHAIIHYLSLKYFTGIGRKAHIPESTNHEKPKTMDV